MCVILVCDKRRPSSSMLKACAAANRDGAGMAWMVNKGNKGNDRKHDKPSVRWRKNLTLDEVTVLTKKVALPFVVHFRIASIGGVRPELCHPFPVSATETVGPLAGMSDAVLFHNGHWAEWAEPVRNSIIHGNAKMPQGPWSDSRGMAFLAARHGHDFLHLIPKSQRIVLVTGKEITYFGNGWSTVDEVTVSNESWRPVKVPPARFSTSQRPRDFATRAGEIDWDRYDRATKDRRSEFLDETYEDVQRATLLDQIQAGEDDGQ